MNGIRSLLSKNILRTEKTTPFKRFCLNISYDLNITSYMSFNGIEYIPTFERLLESHRHGYISDAFGILHENHVQFIRMNILLFLYTNLTRQQKGEYQFMFVK
jgi:hypothetical protein